MYGSVRAPLPLSSSLLTITSFLRRVAELEQENARLLALSSSLSATQPQKDIELVSEVQQLREQLAALKERERTLSAQLASSNPVVKLEDTEPSLSSASPRSTSTTVSSAHKSGASLGLMASAILGPFFVPYVSNFFIRSCYVLCLPCCQCECNQPLLQASPSPIPSQHLHQLLITTLSCRVITIGRNLLQR